jgi:hypothetical protein
MLAARRHNSAVRRPTPCELTHAGSCLDAAQVRMGETGAVKNLLKGGEADPLAPGKTQRGWTPLHIACWGSLKPQNDKDIVEALLLWAQKSGKQVEASVRAAADLKEGLTPADLAKLRRDSIPPPAPGQDEGTALEEKRKFDKIVEWLEKGMPTS